MVLVLCFLWRVSLGLLSILYLHLSDHYTHAASVDPAKPNIIFIITDDQDVRTGTLDYMPKLHTHIAEQGVTFTHFYAPVSLCCPSRVSLLRAQYAHNHNVTYVSGPFGGWSVFCDMGHNSEYLPIFLQEAGYGTYYTGKLMNDMTVSNIQNLPAAGWTNADFLLDPNTYLFYNGTWSANGEAPINHEGTYQMDLVIQKSTAMFQQALSSPSQQPFFLGVAPTAPHMEVQFNGAFTEPIPPPEYAGLFNGTVVPRVPNYNQPVGGPGGGVSWLKGLEELNETVLEYIDHVYRQRLRILQTVDDLVEHFVQQVEDAGIANNTYIIFVADNGYALGSHRRQPGKTLPFEEDVLIPLMIRGPGITPNTSDSADIYSMTDLGATILSLAGATANYTIDGRPISLSTTCPAGNTTDMITVSNVNGTAEETRHTISEYWAVGAFEGIWATGSFQNQTYRSLRVVDGEDEWVYGVWCTGERELFNLKNDPYQLANHAINTNTSSFTFASSYTPLATRLDALLLVVRRCSGSQCLSPWSFIFPNGQVQSLSEALSPDYDAYFAELPKFRYKECRLGFFEDVEGPEWTQALAYGG